jgi:hypothetical protein
MLVLRVPVANAMITVARHSPASGSEHLPGGPVPAPSGASIPAPIVALAAFACLFLLVAALGGAARLFGWSPAWATAWRHSWNEAEYRIGGWWLALGDRFRRRP